MAYQKQSNISKVSMNGLLIHLIPVHSICEPKCVKLSFLFATGKLHGQSDTDPLYFTCMLCGFCTYWWTNCRTFSVFLKNLYFMITVVHDSNLNAKHPIVIKYKLNWNNPQSQLNFVFSTPCFSLPGHLQIIPNLHEILGRILVT